MVPAIGRMGDEDIARPWNFRAIAIAGTVLRP
jgi:hypothetical protein